MHFRRVVLLEDGKGESHLRNLSVLPVGSEQEAMRLLFLGDTNRFVRLAGSLDEKIKEGSRVCSLGKLIKLRLIYNAVPNYSCRIIQIKASKVFIRKLICAVYKCIKKPYFKICRILVFSVNWWIKLGLHCTRSNINLGPLDCIYIKIAVRQCLN